MYVNDSLLDIGCHKGELLIQVKDKIRNGVGIDPHCGNTSIASHIRLINGIFPEALNEGERFDCITALALLEHIPAHAQVAFMNGCCEALNKQGRLIITVPDAAVDRILHILVKLKLVDGMSLEEHFGFDVKNTPGLALNAGFTLALHQPFQFGLNNLFVFIKE